MNRITRKFIALSALLLGGSGFFATAQTSIISTGAVWKYLDDGTDQSNAWYSVGFNDGGWSNGVAQLGYGDDDEATRVNFGGDSNQKFVTTYFRKTFNVPSIAGFTNTLIRLLRDDGIVLYLNGVEIYRDNLPAGEVLYTTLATTSDDSQGLTNFVPVGFANNLLVAGDNVLAAEIHQAALNSSDISFELEYLVNYILVPPLVSITSPTNGQGIAASSIIIDATASDADGAVTNVEFYAGNTLANEMKLGEDAAAPYRFVWNGVTPSNYVLRAVATDATGLRATSSVVNITVSTPPPTLIAINDTWRYWDTNTFPGADWTNLTFNDTTWKGPSPAQLGYGDGDEATVIDDGPDANRYPAAYFRKVINVPNPGIYNSFTVSMVYDDGFLLWINGVEVRREGMPAGPIDFTTLANITVGDNMTTTFTLPTSVLVAGSNIIAVEVHQVSATSSDVSFALELAGVIPPTVTISSPDNNATVSLPTNVTITAIASDGDGTVVQVDFYRDGLFLIGSDAIAPYSTVLSNLTEGSYTLTAIATDNSGNSATSAPVVLNVTDANPPVILAVNATTNTVTVNYNKDVLPPGATNIANYGISGGPTVQSATFGLNQRQVVLTTSFLMPGPTYTLTVNNVQDTGGRPIAANTMVNFTVSAFTGADVGAPTPSGSSVEAGTGYNVMVGGGDISGTADAFHFNYRPVEGDFDLKLRVQALNLSDAWAKAGLMARENLTPGARYTAAFATPSVSGCFFQFRTGINGLTTNVGSAPVTYPNTWLRLKREGNSFTGYFGVDGNSWLQLGSVQNLALPSSLLLGMAVTSRTNGVVAKAEFRDIMNVVGSPPLATPKLAHEPLGPSSRRTPFVISEIMYHPRTVGNNTNRSLEFIEIYNSQAFPENLGGHRISGSVDFAFPADFPVQPGQFVVIARDPAFVQSHYGITGVLGPWAGVATNGGVVASTNGLPGGEGLVRLRGLGNNVLLEVRYEGQNPWPIAADGAGHSLVLARPSYGERDHYGWAASDSLDGSPGRHEPFSADPAASVRINEFLAHTDGTDLDFVELYNHGTTPVDLSGMWLSDEADTNKFRIPNGTTLGATSYVHFTETLLGFSLRATGERIFLVNSNQNRVIDAIDYEGQASGVSSGRSPNGASAIYVLASPTPGAANTAPKLSDVVINEIMYNPISGDNDDEFVELYNRSTNILNVSGWRIAGGIDFTFPSNSVIQPGGYLVVAENRTNLLARYGHLNSANTVGNYQGTLGNGGERIALRALVPNISTNTNTMTLQTNYIHALVNEVTYGDGGRWGYWADGGGSSIELKDADSDNRQPANWGDSDETLKAPWTSMAITGSLANVTLGAPDKLLVYQLGVGECLVDDVEVRNSTNMLIVPNGGLESGLGSWTLQGSHDQSVLRTGPNPTDKFSGNNSLHIRAASRGDNGANRTRVGPFTPTLPGSATNVVIRAKVRWLRGWPEILFQIHGCTLELPGRMDLPTNLGSPGLRNSRAVTNAGPAIYEVAHCPPLPAAGENVIVTARVHDPDGLDSLTLKYRVDAVGASPYVNVAMTDNGAGADAVANDGIYSGLVPGLPRGGAVAFYLEAVDNAPAAFKATNTFPQDVFPGPGLVRCFPQDSLTKECVIRWGDTMMMGSYATYHLWMTLSNINRWDTREELSNHLMDGTFVYNNYRVVYNARPNFGGSPWHEGAMVSGPTNNGGRVDYVMVTPEDDKLLGVTDFNFLTCGNPEGNHGTDSSTQSEQTSYIIMRQMGIHYNYRRYIHYFLNGNHRSVNDNVPGGLQAISIMEDGQQPNSDTIEAWFPDDTDGDFYKIEDWFGFDDNGSRVSNEDADLGRRTNFISGRIVINPGPYRWMWRRRAVGPGDSANNFERLYDLIDVVSPTGEYTELSTLPIPNPDELEKLADMEQWMRIAAAQHAIGNWDAYFYERGKNAYMYAPQNGTSHQWTWDIDFTMGIGGNGSGTSLFALGGDGDRRVQGMWNTPVFLRMYWRAFQDMLDGPWNNAYINPILDAKAAAHTQNRVAFNAAGGGSVQTIKDFVAARRTFIQNQLNTVAAGFNIANASFTNTSDNYLIVSGTAPILIKDIFLNGAYYPVTWTSVTGWQARIVLDPGVTVLTFEGRDRLGRETTNGTRTVTANYGGAEPNPVGAVVFNEIEYNPAVPEGSFVELYNNSDNVYDLSGWRVQGIDYTFPLGAVMTNRQYLLLAKNMAAVMSSYGTNTPPPFATFDGNLANAGEILTLIKPGTNAASDMIVDKVRYENRLPWGPEANGTGASLQLVDVNVDNSRSSAWLDRVPPEGWRQVSLSGTIQAGNGTNFFLWLAAAGSVYIDDISLTYSNQPAGPNFLQNGSFEDPLTGPWIIMGTAAGTNHAGSQIVSGISRTGNNSLRVLATGAGAVAGSGTNAIRQTYPALPTNTHCTLTFWFLPGTNIPNINVRTLLGSGFAPLPFSDTLPRQPQNTTPGYANNVTAPLPAYEPLWLNELQAVNTTGPMDNASEREPWVELYNAGTNTVMLDGYFLANNYDTNLTQWQFPAGSSIGPGQFKVVWMDGETNETTMTHIHAGFSLNAATGSVALVRMVGMSPQVTDYLTYAALPANASYGDYPDGQPFHRFTMPNITPGGTNIARPVNVYINEWMAANTNTIADPTEFPGPGAYDDWFELYNAGSEPVDLGGYFLTDNLGNSDQFEIPNNGQYVIPPGGFLLVWADNDEEINGPDDPDLHVNFALSAGGESIGLYAPDEITLVDSVTFGMQTNDISEGRFPDGAATRYFMSPTPRNPNTLGAGNTAPTLDPIPNFTIRLGETVSYTNTASDAEAPPQVLSFFLTGVPPAGAGINQFSGLFTWTPSMAQAPGMYTLTVRVQDNGAPVLSASRSFNVSVLLPPNVTLGTPVGNKFSVTFDTIPGRTYRVEWTENLEAVPEDTDWNELAIEPAVGTSLTIEDPTDYTTRPRRFYRIFETN